MQELEKPAGQRSTHAAHRKQIVLELRDAGKFGHYPQEQLLGITNGKMYKLIYLYNLMYNSV